MYLLHKVTANLHNRTDWGADVDLVGITGPLAFWIRWSGTPRDAAVVACISGCPEDGLNCGGQALVAQRPSAGKLGMGPQSARWLLNTTIGQTDALPRPQISQSF